MLLAIFIAKTALENSFLLANMVRYKAKHYVEEMRLKRCTVENVLNNGIHLKFPDSEYKVWKSSISNPNATRTKSNYLTQPKVEQGILPFKDMQNVYPLPLYRGAPLRLVILWDLNAAQEIELFWFVLNLSLWTLRALIRTGNFLSRVGRRLTRNNREMRRE